MATAFLRDLRLAVRSLRKRPGFTALAILTLTLGIGANAAIFSVVNGVLLRPLPFAQPERLVTIDALSPQGLGASISVPNFEDWRKRNRVFASLAGFTPWSMTDRTEGRAERIEGAMVFGAFFEMLGVEAALGRTVSAVETGSGADRVVVLSNAFWVRAYGADPTIIGKVLRLLGETFTVIGVMPAGFGFPSEAETAVYIPMGTQSENLPWDDRDSSFGTRALARLADGVTLTAAQSDMDRVTREVDALEGRPIVTAKVTTLSDFYRADVRTPVLILMGAVVFVLLIAAVNVANLLLTRAEGRRREIALCVALGAGRGAIVRQHLAESVALTTVSAVLGLGLGVISLRLLVSRLPEAIPPALLPAIRMDGRVLAFAVVLATIAALAFGIAPAWRAAGHGRVSSALREGGRSGTVGRGRLRLRSALVAGEMALALILLVGAVLMLQTLARLRGGDSGYLHENVLTAQVGVPAAAADDPARWASFYEDLMERVRAEPGVRSAAAMLLVPLAHRSWELRLLPEGAPYDPNTGESVLFNIASLDYFATMGISVVRGRAFTSADVEGAPLVTIIDETMAEKLWPGEDPIGRRITFERTDDSTEERVVPVYRTIVGVVPNVRHYDLRNPSRIQAYVPLQQAGRAWGNSLYVAVRLGGTDAAAFAPHLREAVRSLDRNVVVSRVRTLDGYVGSKLAAERALTALLGVFGVLAVALAAIGVFGVTSILVGMRAKEIGLRLAIGARPGEVLRMILRGTLRLAIVGTLCGLVVSVLLARLLSAVLYGVSALEPAAYAGAATFLVLTSLAASLLPALRAAHLDPMTTLRQEA